jgi:eukaryotic-like serine/threonine-protein kinase
MDERDKLLESIGFDVSDGRDLDWSAFDGATGAKSDQEQIQNLRTLSKIAGYYRNLRLEDQATGRDAPQSAPGSELFDKSSSETSTRMWGHLAIAEAIGSGTYGDVYRARDTRLDRDVALKLIQTSGTEAIDTPDYLREARLLAQVSHPNLVTIHGADIRDGRVGLWMEFVDGVTLHEQVCEKGTLSDREAALLGIDLCGALAAVHKQGLIHRDVKAHNVMREKGGRYVLMDFGSARSIAETEPANRADVGLTGTPMYMAPEVVRGAPADACSEIYSLGVLLYFSVTGDYPTSARDLSKLRQQHDRNEYQRLRDVRPDLPPEFISAIDKSLAPDPARRYASSGEMEEALTKALGAKGKTSDTNATSLSRSFTRKYRYALAGALGGLTVAIVLFWSGLLFNDDYTINAALQRVVPGGGELLLPGARVAPGDQLFLDFEASREMHVYILAEDDNGEAYLLFPLPGHDLGNPLAGNQRHHLPPSQDGGSYNWGVSSAGGTEHLLIVASPEALTDFEATLSALPAPINSRSQQVMRGLRGIGYLVESKPARQVQQEQTGRSAFSMARSLAAGPEQGEGVWVRQVDLINP